MRAAAQRPRNRPSSIKNNDVTIVCFVAFVHRRPVNHGVTVKIFPQIFGDHLGRNILTLSFERQDRLAYLILHLSDEVVAGMPIALLPLITRTSRESGKIKYAELITQGKLSDGHLISDAGSNLRDCRVFAKSAIERWDIFNIHPTGAHLFFWWRP
jgi:hypothetical protein